ncbi:N-6 DNA methylase [Pedobacter aquatilis]|uniref:N-6 DNA methylase n=1 Tax=Pedobacter aquatilis TaxID=351343 RepID=UPI0025B36F25|nr:N-6 DNA methylase [Pedobacter aquatilis]MDN3588068.1 N-6 DNA methylase [Pedobacter aquatilis]
MSKDRTELIKNYRSRVKAANKELPKKEAFKDLLNRLYAGDKDIEKVIDKITGGSEATVLNIPRKDKLHRGSADSLYNKIIIEFENDLKVSLKHAKEQLAGYLLGQFNSGEGYNFTLIVTDCITWKLFAPDVMQLEDLENLKEDELVLNEIPSASFILTDNNTEDFYYWIDRFLFREEKQKATLKRIEESFGYQSNVFIESFRELTKHFDEVKRFGEVQVSYEQWRKFLSIAYGSFDASENNFLIHTYLSIFSKMLAYAVVSNDDYIEEDELKGIINGTIFNKYNIQNFVDNDFFHWIGSERDFRGLKKAFRVIAQEISSFDFNNVDEDILKGVYQELIDLDTRHALGEYYTPDWLCERVVKEYSFNETDKILDPSCGSGSFLRAAIHRIKELNPEISVESLSNNIYGIDIHPLSVQIAKTTMLITLGKAITKAKKPIHINIILANTLLAPEGVKNLFGGEFLMQIDKEKLWLNTQVFEDVHLFDEALEVCENLAELSMNKNKETKQTFENILVRRYKQGGLNPQIIDSFYQIYESLKFVKESGRDTIWKFIVQNLYKPYFLNKKFDYVIGNPPWFTYASIKNEEYQNQLNILAEKYGVKPVRVANFPHLEIAAIFLAYCSSYFLNDNGKIAFVLPRSFFSADHHDNTRSGKAKGFRLTKIWDLIDVSPLFRIPSGVLFAEKAVVKKQIPGTGLNGLSFSGNLPSHNCNLKTAEPKLTEEHNNWFYIQQGKSSAFSTRKTKSQKKVNPYKKLFKQGATIVPRTFYFIELAQEMPDDWEDRIINVKTSDDIQPDAKTPWKGLSFTGKIESNFIFRTALAKSILPFALYKPDLVALPITVETGDDNIKKIKLYSAARLLQEGYSDAAKWFQHTENTWKIHRTEKNGKITSEDYLNWQNKLVDQNLNEPYLVLYNASAKDANATVVKRAELDLDFIVESKGYFLTTGNLNEAFYLTAILNSTTPNLMMKDFQTKGLFGARDVHKRILDIYYPVFDENDAKHSRISELSKLAHEIVSTFLEGIDKTKKVEGLQLGRIRLDIKEHLSQEMKEIDKLVRQIIR